MATIDSSALVPTRVPRQVRIVGGISLLWNAVGAFDYLMTQMRVESYMSEFTPEQVEYFTGFPALMDAAWAFGVWGAVAGSIGLLLGRKWAVWAFGASLGGLIVSSVYTYGFSNAFEVMGGGAAMVAFNAIIWLVAIALFLYSRRMAQRGALV